MRPHGPLFWLPELLGTASQWPLTLNRYWLADGDGSVFVGQPLHDVVDRLNLVGMVLHFPSRELLDVMAGLRLRLRRDGENVLRPV